MRTLLSWIKNLFRGMHPRRTSCVDEAEWLSMVEKLEKHPDVTARFRFTNGKTFIIPEFVTGDRNFIIGRVKGVNQQFGRRGIAEVSLVPKMTPRGSSPFREGRVTTWKGWYSPRFGFVRDFQTGQDYYFNERTIDDQRLLAELGQNKVGQTVRFKVIRDGYRGKPAQIEVLELLVRGSDIRTAEPWRYASDFSRGFTAKNSGRVDEAMALFSKVMENRDDPSYAGAVKEMAQCLNRKEDKGPEAALAFLEKHRAELGLEQQTSVEMMEIIFLQGAHRYAEALAKIEALLKSGDMPENRRTHFERERLRLQAKLQGEDVAEDATDRNETEAEEIPSAVTPEGALTIEGLDSFRGYWEKVSVGNECSEEFRINVTGIIKAARIFASTLSYEDRLSRMREMDDCVSACCHQLVSGDVFYESLLSRLQDIVDATKKVLSQGSPEQYLSIRHQKSARYSIGNDGLVTLDLVLSLSSTASPTMHDITVMPDLSDAEPVPVCDCLIGGESASFTVAFKPGVQNVADARQSIILKFDYQVDRYEGTQQGQWVGTVPVEFAKRVLPKLKADYRFFADGRIPYGDYFVGREEIIRNICDDFSSCEGGRCYLIHGQRRTGKNSLRDHVIERLNAMGGKRYCYSKVSVRGETLGTVLANFMEQIRDSVTDALDPDDVSAVTKLQKDLDKLYNADNYVGRLSYLGKLLRQRGFVWIIAIDEFTDLFKNKAMRSQIQDITGIIRTLLDKKVLHAFIVGMDSLVQLQHDFENDVDVMGEYQLTFLKPEDLESLLRKPMESIAGPDCFAKNTTVFRELTEWSGGVPELAHRLCAMLVDLLNEENRHRVLDGDIEKVGRKIAAQGKGLQKHFNTFFEMGLPGFEDALVLPVYNRIAELTRDSKMCPIDDLRNDEKVSAALQVLIDRGLVVEEGGKVWIRSRLFTEWLLKNPLTRQSWEDGHEG